MISLMKFGRTVFFRFSLFLSSVLFAFGVLGISVVRVSAIDLPEDVVNRKNADIEIKNADMLSSDILGIIPDGAPIVDYPLPYPGNILPGHFLYPFKMFRDRLWLSLTVNVLRKSEMALMLADKRLSTAMVLIENGKMESGVETATKAEKYLEMAINLKKSAGNKGIDINDISKKLEKSASKHEQTLSNLKPLVPNGYKPVIDSCIGYAKESLKILNEVNPAE